MTLYWTHLYIDPLHLFFSWHYLCIVGFIIATNWVEVVPRRSSEEQLKWGHSCIIIRITYGGSIQLSSCMQYCMYMLANVLYIHVIYLIECISLCIHGSWLFDALDKLAIINIACPHIYNNIYMHPKLNNCMHALLWYILYTELITNGLVVSSVVDNLIHWALQYPVVIRTIFLWL